MKKRPTIPKASEVMTQKIKALPGNFTILEAISFFNEMRISSAPVVNQKEEIMGFVSDSDCLDWITNCLFYDEMKESTVDKIMKSNIFMVPDYHDLFEAHADLKDNGLRRAPVVDKNGKILGMISRRDILKGLERTLKADLSYKADLNKPLELDLASRMDMASRM